MNTSGNHGNNRLFHYIRPELLRLRRRLLPHRQDYLQRELGDRPAEELHRPLPKLPQDPHGPGTRGGGEGQKQVQPEEAEGGGGGGTQLRQ